MNKKWSKQAWEAITPVYEGIVTLPFIQELMKGTLDKEKFAFYIQQDALYLVDYGKVLTGLAARLKTPEHIQAFIGFAGDCVAVEKAMHEMFRAELDVKGTLKASPSCLLYTSYLISLFCAPPEVMAAAVLPCFWIYKEVGDYILANQNKENNPFQAWIDMYSGEEFEKSVEKAVGICDELAEKCTEEQRQAMTEAFVMCSKFEWMFWESAYRLERWGV